MPLENATTIGGQLVITAGIYSANDVVGGLQTYSLAPASAGVWLDKVRIVDDDNEKAAVTLHLFNAVPATVADNGAYAPTIAELGTEIAIINIAAADYVTENGNAIAIKDGLQKRLPLPNGKLYVYLTCDATPTYTAITDLWLFLDVGVE